LFIDPQFSYAVAWFWELRSFCDDREKPITPAMINEWVSCQGALLSAWEKDTLFRMDRVFRATLSEEIAYNEERKRKSDERKAKA
jgi:hypothetical protein